MFIGRDDALERMQETTVNVEEQNNDQNTVEGVDEITGHSKPIEVSDCKQHISVWTRLIEN
jgi:hypothetical protein